MKYKSIDKYIEFAATKDGSTGLFNIDIGDVYHSVFGAKAEAEEKFIKPLNFSKNFSDKNEIKVLDICYGIGYNTKAFLKKIIQTNYKGKIKIDILEYDKSLVLISPFAKDKFFESYPEISYILCAAFINQIHENKKEVLDILMNEKNRRFVTPFYRGLIKKYRFLGYPYDPQRKNKAFLHNIHYHCISKRKKKAGNTPKLRNISINTYFDDARKTIQTLNEEYDIIFLDAFTPAKLPTLWSLEFFNELFRISSQDSLLVTYTNSSAVRHAMVDAGFFAGKLFDKEKRHCGTIASKNINLIENKLDGFDIGLMNTNAGIYFKDTNLVSTAEEILNEHAQRKILLNLESSSHYIKTHKKESINASK